MTVKNFGFAARAKAGAAKGRKKKDIPFTLENGGPTYYLRGEINDDGLAIISALFVRAQASNDVAEMNEGMFDTLETLFPKETAAALLQRIKDPDLAFGFKQLAEVVQWAIEEHSGGRPTTSPRT